MKRAFSSISTNSNMILLLCIAGALVLALSLAPGARVLRSPVPRVRRGHLKLLSLNACVLAPGLGFTSDDRKDARLAAILGMAADYDVVLLQEVWGARWSSRHTNFYAAALKLGFDVVHTSAGLFLDSGNVILSRVPVLSASSHIFAASAGWQRLLPNAILHACLEPIEGRRLDVFTTHLHTDTVPYTSTLNANAEATRAAQVQELESYRAATAVGRWLVAGDFNIAGGSAEYDSAASVLGQSLLSPTFPSTYDSDSFLAPAGWRTGDRGVASFILRSCVDHVFTNVPMAYAFIAQKADHPATSDHRPLEIGLSLETPR